MNESVGQQLRTARLARGLSLEEVAKETRIKPHYLEAIEADELQKLPLRFQARGFVRVYSGLLGLDSEALLRQLDQPETPATTAASSSVPHATTSSAFPPALPHDGRPSPASEEAAANRQADNFPLSSPSPEAVFRSPNETAQAIYSQIGAELRRIRNHLGLSIEEVEQQTHLRPHHIRYMEEGRFDLFASPLQGRGFLQIYASFLGLNAEAVLLRYADALQAQLAARQNRQPRRPIGEARPARGKSYSWLWSFEFILMATLSIGTLAFVVWGFSSVMRTRASLPPTPTPFSVAEALLAIEEAGLATPTEVSPTFTPTLLVEVPNPNAGAEQQAQLTNTVSPQAGATEELNSATTAKVQVIISAQQRAWLRVLVDGKELYNGRITPGGIFEYNGEEKIEIQSGNAAALKVIYNRQDLGILGSVGEVVTRVFTPEGVFLPTATITPTATRTPRPSPTPRPTLTLRPTRTPLPTATSSPIPTP